MVFLRNSSAVLTSTYRIADSACAPSVLPVSTVQTRGILKTRLPDTHICETKPLTEELMHLEETFQVNTEIKETLHPSGRLVNINQTKKNNSRFMRHYHT